MATRPGRTTRLLTSIFQRGSNSDSPGLELVVVEGPDAGARFALDRPEIQLGRGNPNGHPDGDIRLNDRSVSSKHAIVNVERGCVTLRHLPTATNPTLVNGRPIKSKQVKAGDEIVIGLVVIELRDRAVGSSAPEAIALTRILEPDPSPAADPASGPAPEVAATTVMTPPGESAPDADPETTQVIAPESPAASEAPPPTGRLMLTGGIAGWDGRRFELDPRRTGIGRGDDCDIALPVSSVSRHHASLLWEGPDLVLVHESKVNPTYLNGIPVEGRKTLTHGDQIRLTEGISFYLILDPLSGSLDSETAPDLGPGATHLLADTQIAGASPTPPEPPKTVVMTGAAAETGGEPPGVRDEEPGPGADKEADTKLGSAEAANESEGFGF